MEQADTDTVPPPRAGDPRLAPTPPMGWNSWNAFRTNIDERLIRDTATAMVDTGMREAGYKYLILDDGWMAQSRGLSGELRPHPVRFPHGIEPLVEYVHDLGLMFGIYSGPGEKTCAGYPASAGFEECDARLFAAWGVDYLKYDWCHATDVPSHAFRRMRDALAATGRPIVYSVNAGGASRAEPWSWGGEEAWALDVANCWRTSNDIWANWDSDGTVAQRSVMTILDEQVGLDQFASPGRWNDPDMLEVGNPGLSDVESRTHFSLWAMLAAPLIAGNDLRSMSATTLATLTNSEIIAVDQDRRGRQGHRLRKSGDHEVWVRELTDGNWAVLLLNRGAKPATIEVSLADITNATSHVINDLRNGSESDVIDIVSKVVDPHGSCMLRLAKFA